MRSNRRENVAQLWKPHSAAIFRADVVRRLEDRALCGLQAPSQRSSHIFPEIAQPWYGWRGGLP
jgi:hypothetical protein